MQVGSRRLILNPVSGTGDHADYVRRLAEARGFEVVETESAEDAVRRGFEAGADGVAEIAVAGGDGTVNDVLRGLAAADHLEDVTLSVVPAGTANILARNLGIHDVAQGIEVADTGRVRAVDLGMADEQPFVVSCIAGLPADASVATSGELKERLGTFAFLVTAAQEALQFDGLTIHLEAHTDERSETYEGDALCVLVGNARKFVEEGGQADMTDGLFHVAVVERMPASSLVTEAITHRLLGAGTRNVQHFRAERVDIRNPDDEAITFSRDGELSTHDALRLYIEPQALSLRVGPGYRDEPE